MNLDLKYKALDKKLDGKLKYIIAEVKAESFIRLENSLRDKAEEFRKSLMRWLNITESDLQNYEFYFPDVTDLIAQEVISYILIQETNRYFEAEAMEEEGYGLPPFALYRNADARSYCGRWGYSWNDYSYEEIEVFSEYEPGSPFLKFFERLSEIIGEHDKLAYLKPNLPEKIIFWAVWWD